MKEPSVRAGTQTEGGVNEVSVELKMPEMKILSEREAFVLLDDGPNGLPLVQQIAQTLLEADLTIRSMNAVLNYVWYVIADTGKVRPPNPPAWI